MFGIPASKKFCCMRYLNQRFQWLFEAGIFQKIVKDEQFFLELKERRSNPNESGTLKILELQDLKGVFIVLLAGFTACLLLFFIEIREGRYSPKSDICFIKKRKKILIKRKKRLTKTRLRKLPTIFETCENVISSK